MSHTAASPTRALQTQTQVSRVHTMPDRVPTGRSNKEMLSPIVGSPNDSPASTTRPPTPLSRQRSETSSYGGRNALGSNSVTFDLGELVEEDPAEAHDDPESFRSLDLDLDPEESEKPLQVEV
mmetsp:Transcript_23619/g.75642  ORF Transcript_23619/g.75642 Transcript_23619/m.75642 type:complete len:123 (+) Transcript_23619:2237-2605(+)